MIRIIEVRITKDSLYCKMSHDCYMISSLVSGMIISQMSGELWVALDTSHRPDGTSRTEELTPGELGTH